VIPSISSGEITDAGLAHLNEGLQSLSTLTHLSLGFGSCKEITDEGPNHVKQFLQKLPSLQHISLEF